MAPRKAYTAENRNEAFPTRLRKAMKNANISTTYLASKIGITPQAVSLYTAGKSGPDWKTLCKIADVCGVSVDWLLGRSDYKKKSNEAITAHELGLSEAAVKVLADKSWLSSIVSSLIELEEDDTDKGRPILSLINVYLKCEELKRTTDPIPISSVTKDSDRGRVAKIIEGLNYLDVCSAAFFEKITENIKKLAADE